jgi:hypothetical protein
MRSLTLIILLFAMVPTRTQASWLTQGAMAYIAMDMHEARKANVIATFVISFNPRLGCSAEVGTIVTQGATLGEKQTQRWTDEKMVVTLDTGARWSENTAITKYTNGVEATFLAPDGLVERLKRGRYVRSQITPGTPIFEFSLEGAASAIETAAVRCRPR